MSKSDQAKAREHRLAAKLRENLRRRKVPAKSAVDAEATDPAKASVPRPEPGRDK